ncbi:threonine ammonia-lyase [Lentzea sp. NPDC004789]
MNLVTISEIRRAVEATSRRTVRTPLLNCPGFGAENLWLKAENLQITGSFKIRGAFNAVSQLSPEQIAAGVVTYSSGNHAQALAYAARTMGAPCTVVMPSDAKVVKVNATKELGAEILLVPPAQRKAKAEALADEHGFTVVPPFDSPHVIAGQGTIGVEIIEDLPLVDLVLVPVGGGAIASGVAAAIKALSPGTSVIGVEPELAADAAEGLRSGELATWSMDLTGRTVADGLRTNLSPLTFAHLREHLDGIVTVSEDEILSTVRMLATQAHLIVEPSGAVAAAAYLHHRSSLPGGRCAAVLSGGNIDTGLLAGLLND